MLRRSILLAWLVAILGVIAPCVASAATTARLETGVRDFELVAATLVGRSTARTTEKHPQKSNAYDGIASGSPLAAEAGGGGGQSVARVLLHETGHTSIVTEVAGEVLHTEQVVTGPLRVTTIAEVAPGDSPVVGSVQLTLPNGAGAQAFQLGTINMTTGRYNIMRNNCFGHCADVLRAGGVQGVPADSTQLVPWLFGGP